MSLLQRMIGFWRNGVSFGGNRDLYRVFGWKRNPTFPDFLDMYRHNGFAKRVVNAPVNALWSDPPSVSGDTAFTAAWNDLLSTQPVFFNLTRLDKLAGLGRYAVLLIGFDDGIDMSVPVRSGKRKVLYLQPYSEQAAKVSTIDTNPQSPRFGQPLLYTIDPGKDDDFHNTSSMMASVSTSVNELKVHYSRILHIAENTLETQVYGRARLETSFNTLCDLQKVTGGSAETYWLAANRGLHVNVDKDMELEQADEEALSEELKEYQHEIRRIIRTRGVEVNEIGSQMADPRGVVETLLSELAADTGIPKRIITGSEAGQLASQQDRASWAQRVQERIAEFGEPVILLPFVRIMIDSSVLPTPKTFSIEWPDAFKMNPLERAQTSAQMARSATNLAGMLQKMEQTNQMMARAALPQLVTAPMTSTASSDSVPTDGGDGGDINANTTTAGGADPFAAPSTQVIQTEPLMPTRPMLTLLTEDECRSIIGFGKHPPIFDDTAVAPSAINK